MRRKILVIDDNTTQCKILKKLFDLRMPWMNGAEFCRQARLSKPETLIYALSGYVHEFDRAELLEAGFDGIFSKPIRVDLLRDAIEYDLKKIRLVG